MPDRTRSSYDKVASAYAAALGDELAGKPLDRALLQAFAELVDGPVADLGCGPGHVTRHLQGLGLAAFGIDLSPLMCAQAEAPAAAGDLTALPLRSGALGGLVCLYTVIHLDDVARQEAYAELARVLRPGGVALLAFHTSDAETGVGEARATTRLLEVEVDLIFHFLDPAAEVAGLTAAGFDLVARLDRSPDPDVEHASQRAHLLLRRSRP